MNRMLALDANWAPQLEEAVRALQALAPTVLPLSSTSHFRTRMMKSRVGKSGTLWALLAQGGWLQAQPQLASRSYGHWLELNEEEASNVNPNSALLQPVARECGDGKTVKSWSP